MDNGYRDLEVGEIKLVGDEICLCGRWTQLAWVDGVTKLIESEKGKYRRPIALDKAEQGNTPVKPDSSDMDDIIMSEVSCDQVGYSQCVAAAIKTLKNLGYTHNGGELWRPPIGKPKKFNSDIAEHDEYMPEVGDTCEVRSYTSDYRPDVGDMVLINRGVILSGFNDSYQILAGESVRYCGSFNYGYGDMAVISEGDKMEHCATVSFSELKPLQPTDLELEIDMLNAYIESEGEEPLGDVAILLAKYVLDRLNKDGE